MPTSASSFLRIVRLAPRPSFATPRILGVDDFALRRGPVYGTMLVDLEQHRRVDLLPDRSADTLATWLRDHAGVEVIARDRSTEYTRGASEGAPSARQVADRWHVLLNLREALERTLTHKHAQLRQLPVPQEAYTHSVITSKPKRIRRYTASEQVRQAASRSARYVQYQRIHQPVAEGVSQREIARQLKMSRVTVRAFAGAAAFLSAQRDAQVKVNSMLLHSAFCRLHSFSRYLTENLTKGPIIVS